MSEKTADMRIIADKISKECCNPARNEVMLLTVWPPMTKFALPTMLMSSSYGKSIVITAKTSGILATMLVLIIVARTPEEIPRFEAGTEPITELALGLRKRPMPKPTNISPIAI